MGTSTALSTRSNESIVCYFILWKVMTHQVATRYTVKKKISFFSLLKYIVQVRILGLLRPRNPIRENPVQSKGSATV